MTDRGISWEGQPPPLPRMATAQRRVALVIGNGAYQHADVLGNPVRDAEAMAAVLKSLGFEVVQGLDLNLRQLGDVQSNFEDKLRTKPDVALLFYAGHGLQVEGRNYLVPIDAEIIAKSHLATRALHFNELLNDMARDAAASLIFLDACRNNPFTRNLARSMGDAARSAGVQGGLARIEKVAGTFIAYATAPDEVAYDGKGINSPFTSALLSTIRTPGLSVGDLMIDVRNKVLAETNNRQEPWDQSSLRARFYFVPPIIEPPRPMSDASAEWAAIQGTTSLGVLAAFQERYPNPPWSTYAEARANELRSADAARQVAEAAARPQQKSEKTQRSPGLKTPQSQPIERAAWSWPFILGSLAVASLVGAVVVWQPWSDGPLPSTAPESSQRPEKPVATAEPVTKPAATSSKPCSGFLAEVVGQGSVCLDPKVEQKRKFQDCKGGFCGPAMVSLPTGDYMQGSKDGDADEKDVRSVKISKSIAVGEFELTVGEYLACVSAKVCGEPEWREAGSDYNIQTGTIDLYKKLGSTLTGDKYPIVGVSWKNARQYIGFVNGKLGLSGTTGYRLLTEAEWEYAARGVTSDSAKSTKYPWGDDIGKGNANCNGCGTQFDNKSPAPVGSFAPNAFGLRDLNGNVWEWVSDCYADSYTNVPDNGSASPEKNNCRRVLRGGSWFDFPGSLRSADRGGHFSDLWLNLVGFRVGRTLTP